MSKWSSYLIALLLLAAGVAIGNYASRYSQPAPQMPAPPPWEDPFPPRQQQTRIPEPVLRPSPTRPEVMNPLLETLREPDAFARLTRLAEMLPGLAPDAIPEVRAALDDYALDLGPAEYDLLLRFWATHDPRGAVMWATIQSPLLYRDAAVTAVVETWAAVDPGSANDQTMAMRMTSSSASRAAEVALVRGWFQSGLPGLEKFMLTLGVGEERQRAIGVYARKTIQRDGTEAIIRWAESVPTDDKTLKLDVNRHVARELVKVDPAAVVAFCDAHCDGPYGTSVRMFIAQNWADRDGRAAMAWVSTAPAGMERELAVKGAFRGWTRSDPDGFWKWLEEMGIDGIEPWFEPVLEVMPKLLVTKDPLAAIAWASEIPDPEKRERTLVIITRRWRGNDTVAADAWLEESPLSEAARAQVLSPKLPVPENRRGQGFPE